MASLPTLYEYYASDGIRTGLAANGDNFQLNNKPIVIYSGAIHYFRVHPDYWRDRFRKLKSCGLNCVETYIPWNIHEPQRDTYDFGDGKNDMSLFCQLEKYIRLAREEDLFIIVRPGPYICSEWEFGGMPSYLLGDGDFTVRTLDPRFMKRVEKYFKELFKILTPLQFTKNGPIIAFQIENEYGNVAESGKEIDKKYLLRLKEIFEENGVVELLFTSDTPSLGFSGTIPGILATANFQVNAQRELQLLKNYQPDKPLMVMEFWTGWFDHWTEPHQTRSLHVFTETLEEILKSGASVNFYMFHGGTNWGFLNGANIFNGEYAADTTSYDYDCLLSEAGDCTEKFYKAKELIDKYQTIRTRSTVENPTSSIKCAYPAIMISQMLEFEDLYKQLNDEMPRAKPLPMEFLQVNENSGQSYGYILYRKKGMNIPENSRLNIKGKIRDQAIVLLNGELKSKPFTSIEDLNGFGYWRSENPSLSLNNENLQNATLDIVVNNWGRVNFGKLHDFEQRKGLYDCNVYINDKLIYDWIISPIEFKKSWNQSLSNWKHFKEHSGPAVYKAVFSVDVLQDAFIDMRGWCQGIVIINGFVLGRYCSLGPQYTLYLPAPFLNVGMNTILVFEQFKAANSIKFTDSPIWERDTLSTINI